MRSDTRDFDPTRRSPREKDSLRDLFGEVSANAMRRISFGVANLQNVAVANNGESVRYGENEKFAPVTPIRGGSVDQAQVPSDVAPQLNPEDALAYANFMQDRNVAQQQQAQQAQQDQGYVQKAA